MDSAIPSLELNGDASRSQTPRVSFLLMTLILSKYALQSTQDHYSQEDDVVSAPRSSIQGVIHFAGFKSVGESIKNPLKYYRNNVAGLVDFCTLLDDFCIKTFVFSSSATVYGELANQAGPHGGRLREELCTHETTTYTAADGSKQTTLGGCTGLTNPYGRTKWMGEAILSDLAASDPDWTIFALRYFNPIGCDASGLLGEDPRMTPTNLMPVVVNVIVGAQPTLRVFGTDFDTADGTAIRDFIHVSDLARGHLAALAASARYHAGDGNGAGFRTFNLGSGRGSSVLEVLGAMEAASGQEIPRVAVGRREGDVPVCVAEPARAAAELNWRTEKTLDVCCSDICRFLGLGKEAVQA